MTWSPRPAGSSPRNSPTWARSADPDHRPGGLHTPDGYARLTAEAPTRGEQRMGMANLQKMAQQMQQEMLRIQTELETTLVDGSAGGGVVKATVTGKQELVSIAID